MGLFDKGTFTAMTKASTVGLHMVSAIFVGAVIGYFLDDWLGTFPYLSAVFFVVGVLAGFYNVWLDTKKILKEQENEDK